MQFTKRDDEEIRTIVRERYGKIAETGGCGCGSSGCCGADPSSVEDIAAAIGYTEDQLKAMPEGANLGLGCGNPLEHAKVKEGETVLDLGSGAGIDAFIAARSVGPKGKVIGVDMTPEMLSRARTNAHDFKFENVEFRLGEIEHLPVADNSVDVIISNCVVNLSPDKPQVFSEARRVLKSGGRLVVSDLVLIKPLSETLKNSVEAYIGCVAGASMKDDYLKDMHDAGFKNIEIVSESKYDIGLETITQDLRNEALSSVASIKVRGVK